MLLEYSQRRWNILDEILEQQQARPIKFKGYPLIVVEIEEGLYVYVNPYQVRLFENQGAYQMAELWSMDIWKTKKS